MAVVTHLAAFGFGAFVGLICGYVEIAAEMKRRRRLSQPEEVVSP